MVDLSDLLVDKSLYGLGMDWRDVIWSPVYFHDVIYHISMLAIDGVTSFLQLFDFQNVRYNKHFSLNKSYGDILTVYSRWWNRYRL